MSENDFTFIDLFSGAGGLLRGFMNQGFKPEFSLEVSHSSTQLLWPYLTYEAIVQGREEEKHRRTPPPTLPQHTHAVLCSEKACEGEKTSSVPNLYLHVKPQPPGP